MKEYLPNKLCVECKGKCCKRMPAPYAPNDILRIFESIEKAIKSNTVAIDWWETSEPLYFIRPKTKGTTKLYDASWGGECIHLTKNGCELPRNKMPHYCKTLEATKSGCNDHHHKHNSKYWAGLSWKKAKIDLSIY